MKALLVILLLVNCGWVLWASVGHDQQPGPKTGPKPRLGANLALLSELPPQPLPESPAELPREPEAASIPEIDEPAASQVAAEQVAIEESVPALLPGADLRAVETPPEICVAMGPFDGIAKVEALREQILAAGGNAEIVEEEIAGRPDYLVYIDTNGSSTVARRMLEELKAQRIDGHIIAGGERKNALSVGVFSSEQRARAQRQRVSALGYSAALQALPRPQTIYHLMADRLVDDVELPGQAACHEIASVSEFL